jgi:hypothetical protein
MYKIPANPNPMFSSSQSWNVSMFHKGMQSPKISNKNYACMNRKIISFTLIFYLMDAEKRPSKWALRMRSLLKLDVYDLSLIFKGLG